MKLFYRSGACSLASHIALHEAGATFEIESVDTSKRTTSSGLDYNTITPKGYVPALQIDSGEVLTEGTAIMQYIADQFPDSNIAPTNGSMERSRLQEQLGYINSELHKAFGPMFNPAISDEAKQAAKDNITQKLDAFENMLSGGREYLVGNQYSVADGYLFVVSSWTQYVGIDLNQWKSLSAFSARIASRPAVQAAMKAEGLIK